MLVPRRELPSMEKNSWSCAYSCAYRWPHLNDVACDKTWWSRRTMWNSASTELSKVASVFSAVLLFFWYLMVVRHGATSTSETPWKRWNTIMEVKFRWFSFSKGWFLGSMLIFRGVRTQLFCDFASKQISYNRESKTEPVTWMNSSPCNTKTGWHELLGEVPFPSCWMIYMWRGAR